MDDRIAWRCTCGNPLAAPAAWRGRPVRCPACSAPAVVPGQGDPEVAEAARRPEEARRERRSTPAPAGEPVPSPYGGWVMRTDGGPSPDDPFFRRFRPPSVSESRRRRFRRWLPLAAAVLGVAVLAGGGILSRHLWKTRWSAAARMERAGFGNRLDRSDGPRWRGLYEAVAEAERRHEEAGHDRASALALRDAYRTALQENCEMPVPRQVHLLNNFSWFLSTTDHPDLREPGRALLLAGQAADLTSRRAAHVLDTLAEAHFASGDPAEAARVEDEALALEGDSGFYRRQAERFRAAAGLPPPAPRPCPPRPCPGPPPWRGSPAGPEGHAVTMPRSAAAFLAVGLVAASQSGNIIRLGDASPVAIAAWRLLMATAILAPFAAHGAGGLRALSRRDAGTLVLAGTALGAHLWTWIAAVQHTLVADAAVFFAVNPVLTAVGARVFLGEPMTPRLALSIAVGLSGVAVMGAGDVGLSADHLLGDGLALACAALFSAYVLAGRRVRQTLDNTVYVTALYGVAGMASFGLLLALGEPAAGYDGRTWLCFALMALVPTILGHTSFNYALRWMPAGRLAVLTLSEPALAGLVAWAAWDERPGTATLAGYGLVCLSVAVLFTERWRRTAVEADGAADPD